MLFRSTVSATGNVTGSYVLGNGSQLTGITSIVNGTSNVTVTGSNANVTVGVNGSPNVAVYATTGQYVTGVVSASGNVSPCCWLDMEWIPHVNFNRIDYMEKINKYKTLRENTLQDILIKKLQNTITLV